MTALLQKLFLLYSILQVANTVKIGISRPTENTTTTTTTPKTTTFLTITNATITTVPTEEYTETIALLETTQNNISTMTDSTTKTTFRPFQVPTLPPKTSKPKIVKIRPKTTTTTTEAPIEYENDDNNDDDDDHDDDEKNTKKPKKSTKVQVTEDSANTFYCSCNLWSNVCDINCCCDPDCSPEALKVFDCYAVPKHPELRTRLEDFQYQHGLPSCRINDGWLCVFRSNVKIEQQKVLDVYMDTSKLHKWPTVLLDSIQPSTVVGNIEYYKFGEPIQLINAESLEVRNFELPYPLINSRCHVREAIKHLKSTSWQCRVENLEILQLNKRALLELITETKLLQKPLDQKLGAAEKAVKTALEIKLRRCITATTLEGTTEAGSETCRETNSTELETENHYAIQIGIVIKHNYTHLNDCLVNLVEQEIKADSPKYEYWQTFYVQFELHNATISEFNEDKIPAISGALGYLQGEPLIMAKFIAYNQSLEMHASNLVLDYFHPNATRWRNQHTLQLPFRRHEVCHKNFEIENLINYGVSVVKQCVVRLSSTNSSLLKPKPDERNFTAICIELQAQAMAQLQVANLTQDIWISQLGKPENNTQQKWRKLVVKDMDFPAPNGVYNAAAQSFTCQNMLLDVAYEFQIGGNFIEQNVPHQQLVKAATLTFGRRLDLEFALTETIELPLTVSVMFYDQETSRENAAESKLQKTNSFLIYVILNLIYKQILLVL